MTSTGPGVPPSTEVYTIDAILRRTRAYFERHGVPSARLDAEVLLARVLGCSRVRLYTHFDQPLTATEKDAYRALVKRRAAFEPVAYICGMREFYGRDFQVDRDVLIPRPETEHVVEAALAWAAKRPAGPLRICDVGSGSGALAVTLAAELPQARVVAVDVSEGALQKTRANAQAHGVAERVDCVASDLLAAVTGPFDIIVSNPPYIAETEQPELPRDVVQYEPALALFGGPDGLDIIRSLVRQVATHLQQPGLFLCEIGHTQHAGVTAMLREQNIWQDIGVQPDLQGHLRVVVACR